MFKNLSIKVKILSSVSFFVLILMFVSGMVSSGISFNVIYDRIAQKEAPASVNYIAETFEKKMEKSLSISKLVADNPYITQWIENGEPDSDLKLAISFLNEAKKNDIDVVFLISAKSNNYYTSDGFFKTMNKETPRDDWFYSTLKSKTKFAINIDISEKTKELMAYINILVGSVDNPVGVAGAGVNLSELSSKLNNTKLSKNSTAYLISKDGGIYAHSSEEYVSKIKNIKNIADKNYQEKIVQALLKEDKGTLEFKNDKGVDKLVVFKTIPSASWKIVFEIPKKELGEGLEKIRNYSILVTLISIAFLVLVLKLLLMTYIFNPLQTISTGMLEVSQGDYDKTIHEDYGKELVLITQAFNKMSKAVLQREQDLRQRQEQFQNLFETMRQGVLYLDETGVIISANPAASRILKIPTDQLVGLSWPQAGYQFLNEDGSLIPDGDLPCQATLKKGTPFRNQIMGMIDKSDKTCTWISVDTVLNEALGKNEAYRIYMMIDDVTEQLHMQNLMVQTEKMMAVGGLAAGIAHEINNPLGIILQTSQNMERRLGMELKKNHEIAGSIGLDYDKMQRYLKERSIDQYIKTIMTAGIRASDIIKNLLDFSRSSESKRTVCHINSIMDDVIEMAANDYDLKKKYDFKSIEIIRDYSEVDPINCIKTEISQVFLNIIKNAAQTMGQNASSGVKPQLIIRTENSLEGGIQIRIKDNGPGISEKDQKSIFQPFFTTKPVGEGTGLGLSVSYFIIHSHHKGRIRVESEKEKGCCFVIDLPKG